MTVNAAVPPSAHNSFSRLPCHAVGLRNRTSPQLCQKCGKTTTHFFGKNETVSFRFESVFAATVPSCDNRSEIFRNTF
jgi:primosomal protein N'